MERNFSKLQPLSPTFPLLFKIKFCLFLAAGLPFLFCFCFLLLFPKMFVSQDSTSQKTTRHRPVKNKSLLDHWLWRNLEHPYPTRNQTKVLAEQAGMSENQVKDWFANTRRELKQDPIKWRRRLGARVARAIESNPNLPINLGTNQVNGKQWLLLRRQVALPEYANHSYLFGGE